MQKLTLALDWTPNINHIGFFVAQKNGFYKDVNLDVAIHTPDTDNYELTPAKKVELGLADFALCPTESIISYRTKDKPFELVAIATLLQNDLSAIATKKDMGINTPRDLDGKIYSSYKARYEDGLVREMIKNDGGNGTLKIIYPEKLGIWHTLLTGEADATWIFLNWEGVEASKSKHGLNYFKLDNYGIPYSYSPVIATNASQIKNNENTYRAFLKATKRGYLESKKNPSAAIGLLKDLLPEHDKNIDLVAALDMTSEHFGSEKNWGHIEEAKLQDFLDWIKHKKLEPKTIETADIFTDVCLP